MSAVAKLKPEGVWKFFEEISKTPRPSGHCRQISDYLVYVLKKYKASDVYRDDANNIIAHFPSNSSHLSHHKTITLHSHVDMVPAKASGSKHDFLKDPIQLVRRGDFVYANHTTLGADDGIGVAMILEIISNKSIKHGPLEIIFTTDEEEGLDGAKQLDQSKLHGKYLFSLDGYEATRPIINSACVYRQYLEFPVTTSNVIFEDVLEDIETEGETKLNRVINLGKQLFNKTINLKQTKNTNVVALKLNISGLLGGHSAVDCNDSNRIKGAIKELFYILFEISKEINFAFLEIQGGNSPTSISTSCHATVLIKKTNADIVHKIFNEKTKQLKQIYPLETNASFYIKEVEVTSSHICLNDTKKIINIVNCLYSGLNSFDTEFNMVSGASNVGVINFDGKTVHIALNQRHMNKFINDRALARVESLVKLLDIKYSIKLDAPAWEQDKKSKFVNTIINELKKDKTLKQKVIPTITPGGCEAALFLANEKSSFINAVLWGPDIIDFHSPNEHLSIKSVNFVFKALCRLLTKIN